MLGRRAVSNRSLFTYSYGVILRPYSSLDLPPLDKDTTKIGWIGTGIMGKSMCMNLMKSGFRNITVYNRTLKKAEDLSEEMKKDGFNVDVVHSPKEVASACDVIFSIVGYPGDGSYSKEK